MARVAATDWSSYDSTAIDPLLHDNRMSDGYAALPEDLRLDAEVSAGFTIRVDDAD